MVRIAAPSLRNSNQIVLPLLFLLLCCLIAYWPLTFHVFSLKNDALNYFLPVRYQVSEAISNHEWPFWSPYFNLGYPLHGDMQSGVWNPFVQFISLFGPYTLKTLEYETLFYIFLSGAGMFFLLQHFSVQRNVALCIATAYMLCGFNSDSAQFLNWIGGASFLPFVFLFYDKAIKETSWRKAIFFGFFFYLLFVTAYPEDFIISAYILFFYLLVHLFRNRKNLKKTAIADIIKIHLVAAVCFLILSLPAVISYSEFLKLSERGSGASYADAMSNPLHPFLLFSYVAPLGVWKYPFVSITDPLERNCFFGLVSFSLLVMGFFVHFENKVARFCKWGFVATLIFTFGEIGGLRPLTYYVLPLMNTFRHPSNAKLFTAFFGCVVAAFSLEELAGGKISPGPRKLAFYIVSTMLLVILIVAIFSGMPLQPPFVSEFNSVRTIKASLDSLSFSNFIALNIVLQLPFLIILYFFLVKRTSSRVLISAGILNCVLFSMLFQPFTVVKKDSVSSIQNVLNTTERSAYPLPDLTTSMEENSREGRKYFAEIGAANMYNKKIGRIDYRITPSNLNTQNAFWFNERLRNELMKYPLLYKADTAISTKEVRGFDDGITRKITFVDDSATIKFINHFPQSLPDRLEVISFAPNEFNFKIKSTEPGFYCLFQNYYPRWNLYVDGKKTGVVKCNVSFMGFSLSPGDHLVSFRYKADDLKMAFFLSLAASLAVLFLGIIGSVKSSSRQ